jgi:predicted O-linked N-acetylglucosamine transferase (SPINDLY family)
MEAQQPSSRDIDELLTLFSEGHYTETEIRAGELVARFPDHGFGWKVLAVVLRQQGQMTTSLLPMQKAAELLPDDAEAHSNLGVTLMNQGQLAEAVISYRRALTLNPDTVDVHHHLGLTLMTLGQLPEAAICYQRVLALNPDYPNAHYNLGRVFQEQGRFSEAESCYRRVLQAHPELSEVHSNLAFVLHWQGQFEAAESSYQRALTLNPHDIKAYSNLGLMLQTQGRLTEARDCYQCVLEINPQFAEIHNNLGIIFHELALENEAKASYQRALAINPHFSEAYNNLGLTLQEQGYLTKAEAAYRNALTHNPNYSEAHNNLGIVFQQRGQLIEALASYQRALALKPDDAQIHNNLGAVYKDLGRTAQAEVSFRRALAIKPDYLEARSNLLFVMNYHTAHSPADCLAEAQQYGLKVKNKVESPFSTWLCVDPPERLRVGIVSGDLLNHEIGLFLANLLPKLDSSSIELIAYPTYAKTDDITEQLQTYFTEWKPLIGLNDESAARLIYSDGIHILFDLSGHSNYNRLPVFAWKPAPIQVSWLGFLATSGLTDMDYVLGDPYVTPSTDAGNFSENLWQLPDTYRYFNVPESYLEVNSLPALSSNVITFGSFNSLSLMNEAVVACWSRILHAIPDARLLLKTHELNDAAACSTICQRFAEQGILPERLLLEGSAELFAAYHRVDIALNTFPYCDATTSVNALYMGVPVITHAGDRFISRLCASIMHNADLADWIAVNEEEYVAKAVHFTANIEKLAILRTQLRQHLLASPLFDATSFARNFEAALWSMYLQ